MNNDNDVTFADSDFLAQRDLTVNDFRASDKESKHKIIEKMLTLRHNMKYNKHLLSVYMKAKGIFDTMVEEHRSQLYYLDEIYRHVNQLIRENLSTRAKKPMMSELIKDKKRIGTLLKKMRSSYEKLMNVDTVIGVTIDKMNEITFMEDDAQHAEEHSGSDDEDSYVELDEAEDSDSEDSEAEDDEAEDDSEDSEAEDDEDDEDDEAEVSEADEDSEAEEDSDDEDSEAEEDDDIEAEDSEAEDSEVSEVEESEADDDSEADDSEDEFDEAGESDEEESRDEPVILLY
jgi:hypothetical protein